MVHKPVKPEAVRVVINEKFFFGNETACSLGDRC
jgi:hypothetical protein